MTVYRYLSQKELDAILSKNTQNIGAYYKKEDYKRVNSHNYKEGIRYLHFFKDTKLIHHISFLHKNDKQDYYICKFDIPLKYLLFHRGIGKYDAGGYKAEYRTAVEFAIDAKNFNPQWLIGFKKDENKDLWDKMIR